MHSLSYILHFFRDLLIIFCAAVGVRILEKAIGWLNSILGTSSPDHSSIPSYLPIDIVAAIVTVLDTVAIVTISIIGISTVMKAWQEHQWWQQHHNIPCDHPECPYNNSHTSTQK
jgi:uncharacterized membrane protein